MSYYSIAAVRCVSLFSKISDEKQVVRLATELKLACLLIKFLHDLTSFDR